METAQTESRLRDDVKMVVQKLFNGSGSIEQVVNPLLGGLGDLIPMTEKIEILSGIYESGALSVSALFDHLDKKALGGKETGRLVAHGFIRSLKSKDRVYDFITQCRDSKNKINKDYAYLVSDVVGIYYAEFTKSELQKILAENANNIDLWRKYATFDLANKK